MTVSTAISAFIEHLRVNCRLSPRTIKAYKSDLKELDAVTGEKDIGKVNGQHIASFVAKLAASTKAPATIKRKIACLKSFDRYLENEQRMSLDWRGYLHFHVKSPSRLPRAMACAEIEKLLLSAKALVERSSKDRSSAHFQALRNYTIIELLFATGMRIDEVSRLNCGDMDLPTGRILIWGKGSRERVSFVTSREVLSLLQSYFEERESLSSETDALFLNRFGNRLSVHSFGPIFQKVLGTTDIAKHYTPHCIRHTFATMLIENGADLRCVQELLGHRSVSTTQIYVAVSSQHKRRTLSEFSPRRSIKA